jgi:hypothetical protein
MTPCRRSYNPWGVASCKKISSAGGVGKGLILVVLQGENYKLKKRECAAFGIGNGVYLNNMLGVASCIQSVHFW